MRGFSIHRLVLLVLFAALPASACDQLGLDKKSASAEDDGKDEDGDQNSKAAKKKKSNKKSEEKTSSDDDDDDDDDDDRAGDRAELGPVDYYADPARLQKDIGAALDGDIEFLKLVVRLERLEFEARDPTDDKRFLEIWIRGSEVVHNEEEKLSRKEQNEVDELVFKLGDISLDAVPLMVTDTLKRFGGDDPKISHMIVWRKFSKDKSPNFHFYRDGSGPVKRVVYDHKGEFIRTYD